MVEIAKALSKNAGILVLDEPTAALAENDTRRLFMLLHQLKAKGVSCVYISHRLEEVAKIADRVTVLRDGRSVATSPAAQMPREKIIAHMVGREVRNLYPRSSSAVGQTLLAVQNFSVMDPENTRRKVVDHVSFEIRTGEILGIAGLMGSGRTALLSSLFGAGRGQVQGTIQLEGRSRGPFQSPNEAIRAGIALVSEDRKRYGLVLGSTVRENLVLATFRKWVRNQLLNWTVIQEVCEEEIRELSIKTSGLLIWVNELSGGNQQKVVLGKWLMAHPRILLLDEPTRGIDVGAKAEIYELMKKLTEQGIGIVLVSSDLPELLGLSHRIVVLNQGRVSAKLSAAEASPERIMEAATTHSFHPATALT
jgi:D-xylose transport system ATP-binding protein